MPSASKLMLVSAPGAIRPASRVAASSRSLPKKLVVAENDPGRRTGARSAFLDARGRQLERVAVEALGRRAVAVEADLAVGEYVAGGISHLE